MKKLALVIDSAGDFRFQGKKHTHVYFLKTKKTQELELLIDELLDSYEEIIVMTNNQEFHDANKHLVNVFNGRCMILNIEDEHEIHEVLWELSHMEHHHVQPQMSMIFHMMRRQVKATA